MNTDRRFILYPSFRGLLIAIKRGYSFCDSPDSYYFFMTTKEKAYKQYGQNQTVFDELEKAARDNRLRWKLSPYYPESENNERIEWLSKALEIDPLFLKDKLIVQNDYFTHYRPLVNFSDLEECFSMFPNVTLIGAY